ncbi:hypothetical protein BH23GEM2_BH23GEM2_22960 [soil metagenome]
MLIVPLKVRDRILGAITLASAESGRRYGEAELALATELADRAALAVENARLYQSAIEAQQPAETANRARSEFLAVMSYELRTPLNAIAGHVDYDLGRVSVAEVLRELEPLASPLIEGKGLSYSVSAIPAELAVHVDKEKTQQILLNLVSNAVKFTDAGGSITMSVTTGGGQAELSLHDTGCGIPDDKLEVIFTPFLQLDRSLSTVAEGTGLGLAISRDLARGMGGDLRAASRMGEGSTFTLALPLAIGD